MIIKTEYTVGVPIELLEILLKERAMASGIISEENGEVFIEGLAYDVSTGYITVDSVISTRLDS